MQFYILTGDLVVTLITWSPFQDYQKHATFKKFVLKYGSVFKQKCQKQALVWHRDRPSKSIFVFDIPKNGVFVFDTKTKGQYDDEGFAFGIKN